MTGGVAAVWGALGALGVEGLEFAAATRTSGKWPWLNPQWPPLWPWAMCVLVRIVTGAIVAGALGASAQVSGQFGALTAGIAAPMLLQQTARQVPREPRPSSTPADPAGTGLEQGGALPARPGSGHDRPRDAGGAMPYGPRDG